MFRRYLLPMIFGYAYSDDPDEVRALPDELRAHGADRVFVDHAKSGRAEREGLFRPSGLREGNVLLLLSRSHLGRGREIARFEAIVAERGASIRIPEKAVPIPKKPGPAPRFRPDYDQERRIRHYWHGPYTRQEALRQAAEVMGHRVPVAALNRYLGPRSKPKAWINAPEASDA